MANSHAEVVRRLAAIPGDRDGFQAAFGTQEIWIELVARAIATLWTS
jgi:cytochrome c peroxidase